MIVEKPFNLDIDVTPQTPLNEIPESYLKPAGARIHAAAQDDKNLKIALEELSINPDIENYLLNEIHRTVTYHDDHVVNVAFHSALSAYSKPLNLALKAESGSGKTYSTTQTVLFMPQEDVLYIASQSPKVISHEKGVRKAADGRNFDDIPEPQKPCREDCNTNSEYQSEYESYREHLKAYRQLQDESYFEVDLRSKIILFLEGVTGETFKMFKATMSHDNEENGFVDHKFVDDKGKVHKTRLVGAPCLIFNSLDNQYASEFATRCLTATPNTSKDKIAAAMEISNRKSSFPWEYQKENFTKRLIQQYIRCIRDIMRQGKISVVNPFTDLHRNFGKEQTRSMRDFNKYLELLGPYAMLKLFQRPVIIIAKKRYLVPAVQDALNAKAAFDAILQTTQTGTEQRVISFYWEIVANNSSATMEQLADLYNKDRKHKVSTNTIRNYLNRLIEIGWVDERDSEHENSRGYIDKRFKTYLPLEKSQNASNLNLDTDFKALLQNSFENWLETIKEKDVLHPQIIIPKIDGTAIQITIEEMKNIVLGNNNQENNQNKQDFSATVFAPNLGSIEQNNPKSTSKTEIETIQHTSKTASKEVHYRRLSPNEPHPCDYYGCGREASYKVSEGCFCDGKDVSHFKEVLAKNQTEGFTNIEDKPNLNEQGGF